MFVNAISFTKPNNGLHDRLLVTVTEILALYNII